MPIFTKQYVVELEIKFACLPPLNPVPIVNKDSVSIVKNLFLLVILFREKSTSLYQTQISKDFVFYNMENVASIIEKKDIKVSLVKSINKN